MSLTKAILDLKISDLGLNPINANKLAVMVRRPTDRTSNSSAARAALTKLVTVGDVIRAYGRYRFGFQAGQRDRAFIQKLEELGVSRLDWICMPARTVTREMITSLPRHVIKKLPAVILETVSNAMLRTIAEAAWDDPERGADLTIGQMLEFDRLIEDDPCGYRLGEAVRGLAEGCWKGLTETRRLLREANFTDDDGRFMTIGMRVDLERSLAKKHNLTANNAELVVRIAQSEGWLAQFLED